MRDPSRVSLSLSSGAHSRDPLAHPGYELSMQRAVKRLQNKEITF